MRRSGLVLLALLLVLCLVLAGCVKKYTINGFVGDAQSRPIAGAQVSAETNSGIAAAYTDSSGYYKLRLEAGSYNLNAQKGGYFPKSTPLVVNADAIGPTFSLVAAAPGTVSGTISFAGSTPASIVYPSLRTTAPGVPFLGVPAARGRLDAEYDGLIVRFRESTKPGDRTRSLGRLEAAESRGVSKNLYHVRVRGDARAAMAELGRDPAVDYVQLNYLNHLSQVPNDPSYGDQWNLSLINMPDVWDHVKGSGVHITVAVLDTGIWTNNDMAANLVAGYDVVNNDTDATDDVTPSSRASHGTHVAGIIGAVTNNGSGLAGVGWNLQVMPIKVFTPNADEPYATDLDLAEGIRKAVDLGARVINMSLGGPVTNPSEHPEVENALKYAEEHNVAIFAAAGNEANLSGYTGTLDYPGSSQHVFAVGAVGHDGLRASYSNYGPGLGLVAPGGSAEDVNDWQDFVMGYGRAAGSTAYAGFAGTSQATPHVAAVAALMYIAGVRTSAEIYQILRSTATPAGDTLHYGSGLLNAGAAIHAAVQVPISLTQPEIYAAILNSNGSWTKLTTPVYADESGSYTITGVPAYQPNLYVVASIDFDGDGIIETGEYIGKTLIGSLAESEQKSGVNIVVLKVSGTASTRSIWSRLLSGGSR